MRDNKKQFNLTIILAKEIATHDIFPIIPKICFKLLKWSHFPLHFALKHRRYEKHLTLHYISNPICEKTAGEAPDMKTGLGFWNEWKDTGSPLWQFQIN